MGVRIMKRVKRIKAKDAFTDVTVTVEIKSKNGWRSRPEMDRFSSSVASAVMHHLSSSAHLRTSLDKIKVA
ncbi:hypothetical protein [Bradyrhizobium phage BDU-MI-1]|nr:hypothetical protein [Bradyrhizobium phage BDU-MI-1]